MIEIQKYSELKNQIRNQLDLLIEEEFGHIPLVKEIKWATPDWTIINYYENEIATVYNVIERTVTIDNEQLKAAGINNVITRPKFRGKGFSTSTLADTEHFLFDNLEAKLGLLLCAEHLVPFYRRLSWYNINCKVYFNQASEKKLWTANTMLLSKMSNYDPGKIDLNGLPW